MIAAPCGKIPKLEILFERTVRFLLCDKLLICNDRDSEVFTINNKNELGELQKYFLDTLNIDIAERYLFWKPPYDIAKIIVNKMNKFMKFQKQKIRFQKYINDT